MQPSSYPFLIFPVANSYVATHDSVKPKGKVFNSFVPSVIKIKTEVAIDHHWLQTKMSFYLCCSISIYLRGCSCVSRPSRTGWTTSICRARHPELLRLLCANGCSAPNSRWLRWRSSRLRLPHSSTQCDTPLWLPRCQSGSLDLHVSSLVELYSQKNVSCENSCCAGYIWTDWFSAPLVYTLIYTVNLCWTGTGAVN